MSHSTHIKFNCGLSSIETTIGSGQLAMLLGVQAIAKPKRLSYDETVVFLLSDDLRAYLGSLYSRLFHEMAMDWVEFWEDDQGKINDSDKSRFWIEITHFD